MAPILQVENLHKNFGGFTALSGVSLALAPGERLGLIGPNGSGKTTLINCVSGLLALDGGRIVFDGQDVSRLAAWRRARLGIARSFQVPRPFASHSVLENLRVPLEYLGARRPGGRAADAEAEAMAILEQMGLAAKAGSASGSLSQVELRKLELARAMAAHPRLLVSDEAMAGLSAGEVDEVLEILFALNARGIAVIMIEHIMQAVMRFSQRVLCLDAGRVIGEGTPEAIVASPDVQRAYLGA